MFYDCDSMLGLTLAQIKSTLIYGENPINYQDNAQEEIYTNSSIRDTLKNKQPHAGQAIIDGKETKLTWKYID